MTDRIIPSIKDCPALPWTACFECFTSCLPYIIFFFSIFVCPVQGEGSAKIEREGERGRERKTEGERVRKKEREVLDLGL